MDHVLCFFLRSDCNHVVHLEPDECVGLCDPSGAYLDSLRPYCVYHFKDPEEKMEAILGWRSGDRLLCSLADMGMDRRALCPDDNVCF